VPKIKLNILLFFEGVLYKLGRIWGVTDDNKQTHFFAVKSPIFPPVSEPTEREMAEE